MLQCARIFFCLYLIFKPIYLWQSGLPQVCDVFMVLSIFFSLISYGEKRREACENKRLFLKLSSVFFLYLVLVNLVWSLIENDLEPVIYALFYIYNALIILAYLMIASYDFLRKISYSIFISLLLLILTIPVLIDFSVPRQVLTFNNPNQLGFFALAYASIISLIYIKYGSNVTSARIFILANISSFVLVFLSMSVAAIGGFVLLAMINVFYFRKNLYKYVLFVPVIIFIALCSMMYTPDNSDSSYIESIVEKRINRKENISENVSFWEERGYDRIYNQPEYLILGAGEGLRYRIDSYIGMNELHSLYGTILYSYGFVGIVLFLFLVFYSYLYSQHYIYMIPVGFYSITHQSLRATLLWLLFCFIVCRVSGNNEKSHNIP